MNSKKTRIDCLFMFFGVWNAVYTDEEGNRHELEFWTNKKEAIKQLRAAGFIVPHEYR